MLHASTYSGDNYPGHPHHKAASLGTAATDTSPLQRSVNDLAYALNLQDDLLKRLASRTAPVSTGVSHALNGCPSDVPDSPKSKIRSDIDGQTARIYEANRILSALIESIEA